MHIAQSIPIAKKKPFVSYSLLTRPNAYTLIRINKHQIPGTCYMKYTKTKSTSFSSSFYTEKSDSSY